MFPFSRKSKTVGTSNQDLLKELFDVKNQRKAILRAAQEGAKEQNRMLKRYEGMVKR